MLLLYLPTKLSSSSSVFEQHASSAFVLLCRQPVKQTITIYRQPFIHHNQTNKLIMHHVKYVRFIYYAYIIMVENSDRTVISWILPHHVDRIRCIEFEKIPQLDAVYVGGSGWGTERASKRGWMEQKINMMFFERRIQPPLYGSPMTNKGRIIHSVQTTIISRLPSQFLRLQGSLSARIWLIFKTLLWSSF